MDRDRSTCAAPLVELRGVSKTYAEGDRRHLVLDDVSLDVARGQLVVLLGRSGSGKSTLLNLLGGLDRPDRGSVRIDGVGLDSLDETARTRFRRRHIGFLFQAFNLIPTLTVAENLLLPLELNRRTASADRDRALDLLAEVGLGDRAGSYPESLSGGEQQRVALARALVHDPDLVLADEPTGNLDLDTARAVVELLDRLTRQSGKTLIMATHGREVVGIADRLLAVHEAKLVERAAAGGAAPSNARLGVTR